MLIYKQKSCEMCVLDAAFEKLIDTIQLISLWYTMVIAKKTGIVSLLISEREE